MSYEAAAQVPPIPARTHSSQQHSHHHHHSSRTAAANGGGRRRSVPGPSADPHTTSSNSRRSVAPPTSPEVISNLISSLSIISKPSSSYFDNDPAATSLSVPASPGFGPGGSGSFGVEYGAYTPTGALHDVREESRSLDDLAASSPVIRTSKPPSGFSPLTAPKSPSREGGLRSFIRSASTSSTPRKNSRPSSPGSLNSKNDDTQSIGNLSIERGSAPTPELKRRRSHDSWGKKASSRSSKGLMYMSSREAMREKDLERRSGGGGGSGGAGSGGAGGVRSSSQHSGRRSENFLAETPISEESPYHLEPLTDMGMDVKPHTIPARDSSLRKTGSSTAKRSSGRRSKREHEVSTLADPIAEADEHTRSTRDPSSRKQTTKLSIPTMDPHTFLGYDSSPDAAATTPAGKHAREASRAGDFAVVGDLSTSFLEDDGAPFPAVGQSRRRDDRSAERNGGKSSGRQSPGPSDALNVKRSSSRMKKRLSGHLQPRPTTDDGPTTSAAHRDPSSDTHRPQPPAGYERPTSADSIDDAVESYLCSPRLSQKIRHPQTGRTISFSEVGDSEGSAVFCCVGMGLTRYITAFYDELALTLKLRLITPDRPGVGDSEAYPDGTATPLGWPDDVYAICQALKITKFSILAHSAGAIYALATALRMPQHIRGRIHLLAPWIPPSQMNVFGASQTSPPTNAIPTSQRILRALPTPFLKAANSSFMTATSSSITSSLPKQKKGKRKSNAKEAANAEQKRDIGPSMDQENLGQSGGAGTNGDMPPSSLLEQAENGGHAVGRVRSNGDHAIFNAAASALADRERQATYDQRLTHAIWELATTGANPAVDLLVCLERRHTIGFRYVDITRPVVVHHGSRDTRVPVENVRWLGKTMKRCEVRVLEGEGHGLMASAGVMGGVLMEISKEWEDWMRVTGADGRRERGRRGTIGRS